MDLSKEMLEQVYIPCIEISLTCVKYFTILCSGTLCDACIPTTCTYVQQQLPAFFDARPHQMIVLSLKRSEQIVQCASIVWNFHDWRRNRHKHSHTYAYSLLFDNRIRDNKCASDECGWMIFGIYVYIISLKIIIV